MQYSYLTKSDESYDSGENLRANNLHNSSIHCYYYACLQMCNHYFHVKENMSDNDIRTLFSTPTSHEDTIGKMVKKIGLSSRKALTVDFSILKDKRVLADYRIFPLGDGDSQEAKDLYDNIIACLKKII